MSIPVGVTRSDIARIIRRLTRQKTAAVEDLENTDVYIEDALGDLRMVHKLSDSRAQEKLAKLRDLTQKYEDLERSIATIEEQLLNFQVMYSNMS